MTNKLSRLGGTSVDDLKQIFLSMQECSTSEGEEEFRNIYAILEFEVAKKQSDALLVSAGMNLQAKLTAFAAEKIDEISETIGQSRVKFMSRIKAQLEKLEEYKEFPDLYEPARQSVKEEISTYFDSIDSLLAGFLEALKARVATS